MISQEGKTSQSKSAFGAPKPVKAAIEKPVKSEAVSDSQKEEEEQAIIDEAAAEAAESENNNQNNGNS